MDVFIANFEMFYQSAFLAAHKVYANERFCFGTSAVCCTYQKEISECKSVEIVIRKWQSVLNLFFNCGIVFSSSANNEFSSPILRGSQENLLIEYKCNCIGWRNFANKRNNDTAYVENNSGHVLSLTCLQNTSLKHCVGHPSEVTCLLASTCVDLHPLASVFYCCAL